MQHWQAFWQHMGILPVANNTVSQVACTCTLQRVREYRYRINYDVAALPGYWNIRLGQSWQDLDNAIMDNTRLGRYREWILIKYAFECV